jgi:hypothetical protein
MKTRKQRALQLRRTIVEGPASLLPGYPFGPLTKEEYDNWAQSYLLPAIDALIPELKKLKKPCT